MQLILLQKIFVATTLLINDCHSNNQMIRTIAKIGKNHKLKKCRHGIFLYNALDNYIGKSLDVYGEWSNNEWSMLSKFIHTGQIVIDVGANIGTFTIPMATKVGKHGIVHAFEPQRVLSQILSANAVLNELHNVHVHNIAVGSGKDVDSNDSFLDVPKLVYTENANYGAVSIHPNEIKWKDIGQVERVKLVGLDEMFYIPGDKCPSVIKIDVEGMELMVLQGSSKLLKECKPVIHVENNCVKDSSDIIKFIDSFQIYICHWDVHPYFNSNNFARNTTSVFPDNAYSINILCYPNDMDVSDIKELQNITKIDATNEKYELTQYGLRFENNEDIILGQLGTKDVCIR